MSNRDSSNTRSLTRQFISGDMSRRDFMKRAAALGITAAAAGGAGISNQVGTVAATNAAFTPEMIAQRARAQLAEVPREETLVAVRSDASAPRYVEFNLWNPFLPAANHQLGSHMTSEPLAFCRNGSVGSKVSNITHVLANHSVALMTGAARNTRALDQRSRVLCNSHKMARPNAAARSENRRCSQGSRASAAPVAANCIALGESPRSSLIATSSAKLTTAAPGPSG